MDRAKILEQLNEVFCGVFDNADLVITEETTALDIDGWDSLEHINLIVACGEKFGIKFDILEMEKMKNVSDMIEIVDIKLKKKDK